MAMENLQLWKNLYGKKLLQQGMGWGWLLDHHQGTYDSRVQMVLAYGDQLGIRSPKLLKIPRLEVEARKTLFWDDIRSGQTLFEVSIS